MTPDEYREQHGMDDDYDLGMPDDEAHDGPLVVFKSIPDCWQREYIGNKPNTVRLLDWNDDRLTFADECMEVGEPASVEIINSEDGRIFFRRITDICHVGSLLGKEMWCISWKHEDGVGTYRDPEDGAR